MLRLLTLRKAASPYATLFTHVNSLALGHGLWYIFSIPFIHVTLGRALLELHYTSWTCAWCERTFIYICKPASLHSSPQWFNNLWTWVQNQHYIYTYLYNNWGHIYMSSVVSLNSDIPKSSALQSCIFPVAKCRGVIHKFNHKFDTLAPISLYQFEVLYYLQNILSRCSHFLILCE